jgi:hypothetical protein
VVGSFCSACGEEQPGHHDLSLRHFFHEVFHEFVHLDSRLFRTLKALIFQPGFLTVEYFAGRKARYFRPLRLFLVIFALNFFVYSLYRPVTIYDFQRVLQTETSGVMVKLIDRKAEKQHTTREELVDRISHRWAANVSLLQLLSVFLLAVILKLVYLPKRKFYIEHLVFAFHLYSFTLLWNIALWPLFYALGGIDPFGRTLGVTLLTFTVGSIYVFTAMRRVYQDSFGTNLYRSILVLVGAQLCFGVTVSIAIIAAMFQLLR